MQVKQHHSPTISDPQFYSTSPRDRLIPMANHLHQPLIFSIDDRLAEQHWTRLDLSSRNLKRIEPLTNEIDFNIVNFDQNDISKLEHLDGLRRLIQLSISHNRLVDIRLLARLRFLQKLNLSHNQIDSIDPCRTLEHLVMINVSHNHICTLAPLSYCHSLQSLDASHNAIQHIDDLSQLNSLKYLNLHKNFINTILLIPRYWPKALHTLIISDNEIQDLTEVACLSSFLDLNMLYIADNPCLTVVDQRYGCQQLFDYRPYVLNWCLNIQNLDGIFTTRKETLKAEWLFSQGKGRSFHSGEHAELVEYLIRVCGVNPNDRDDLHLSRILFHQELNQQQRQNFSDSDNRLLETMTTNSDTMRDAYDTLSAYTDNQQRRNEIPTSNQRRSSNLAPSMRTPSPTYPKASSNSNDVDSFTTSNTTNRYSQYDNRPIKPLDQQMLQAKLEEYPVSDNVTPRNSENTIRTRSTSTPQANQRLSTPLAYNANRYSPKTTPRGPTASAAFHLRSVKTSLRHTNHRCRRSGRTPGLNTSQRTSNDSRTTGPSPLRAIPLKIVREQRQAISNNSNDNQNLEESDGDSFTEEPVTRRSGRKSTTMNPSIEFDRITSSVETMRTSILNAYFDLQARFTKTTELQTSALAALSEKCETEHLNHQRDMDEILRENRSLHQRIRDLELRLESRDSKEIRHSNEMVEISSNNNSLIYPPLRAHISKRNTKSFFLHWIPNPLNENRNILGYRIFVNDRVVGTIDAGRFEAIIDSIREEGEYRIKIRTFDEHNESADSNIVVARFRRQQASMSRVQSQLTPDASIPTDGNLQEFITNPSEEDLINSAKEETNIPIVLDRQPSQINESEPVETDQKYLTPDRSPQKLNEHLSPHTLSPCAGNSIITRKPPKSPTSSPSQSGRVSPCNKVLFSNQTPVSDVVTIRTAKRSPTRVGIMSRLAKSPFHTKQNGNSLNQGTAVYYSEHPSTKTNNQPVASQLDSDQDDQDDDSIQNQLEKPTGHIDVIETHPRESNLDRELDEFSSSPPVTKSPRKELRKSD